MPETGTLKIAEMIASYGIAGAILVVLAWTAWWHWKTIREIMKSHAEEMKQLGKDHAEAIKASGRESSEAVRETARCLKDVAVSNEKIAGQLMANTSAIDRFPGRHR